MIKLGVQCALNVDAQFYQQADGGSNGIQFHQGLINTTTGRNCGLPLLHNTQTEVCDSFNSLYNYH